MKRSSIFSTRTIRSVTSTIPMMEVLDKRRLCSTAPTSSVGSAHLYPMNDGSGSYELMFTGSSNADTIKAKVVASSKEKISTVEVTFGVGSKAVTKKYSNIGLTVVDGAGGNDNITVTGLNLDDSLRQVVLIGGSGDDTIVAKNFDGYLSADGGNGNDTIDFRSAFPSYWIIDPMNSRRSAYGGDGNDTIYGDNTDNDLFGGNGNDKILGYAGNDTIGGGAGYNNLFGGSGNDAFYVYALDMPMYGANGFDRIYGESGDDVVVRFYDSEVNTSPVFGYQVTGMGSISGVEFDNLIDLMGGGKG